MTAMTEYASRGDQRRSMALLWGRVEVPGRGPKQGLSVAAIAAAAIALADEAGLEAVSMRKVAERLGRTAMSLYTYLPGKTELLDVMLDTVLAEEAQALEPVPDDGRRDVVRRGDGRWDGGWRDMVEASARRSMAFYERHPWVLQISGSRALLGPNELDVYEAQLRLLDGLGLTGAELARTTTSIADFVRSGALAVTDARRAEQVTGMSDEEWWNERSPLLEEMSGGLAERFPIISRVGDSGSSEEAAYWQERMASGESYTVLAARETFEFGLRLLLDGVELLISRRRTVGVDSDQEDFR